MLTSRQALAGWAALAVFTLSACGEKLTPQELIAQAETRLAANDPVGAERLLREALSDAPNDAHLHIVLARAELASGHPGAAQGTLERATMLGASKEEVASDLSRVLLAKGDAQGVLDLVGDVDQWPQPQRLVLALSKAEAG